MKKIVFIVLCIIFGIVIGTKIFAGENAVSPTKILSTKQISPSADKQTSAVISQPSELEIPSLKVRAPIESVGMDSQGRMDVPKEDMNVAWYNLGYKPGSNGSAVIAGHFDRADGSPAVFYNLSKLKAGDEIIIKDATGKKLRYIVEEKKQYPDASFPLQKVFNTTDQPRLNLITCDGVWNPASKNYSQRLVIFATLSSSTP